MRLHGFDFLVSIFWRGGVWAVWEQTPINNGPLVGTHDVQRSRLGEDCKRRIE